MQILKIIVYLLITILFLFLELSGDSNYFCGLMNTVKRAVSIGREFEKMSDILESTLATTVILQERADTSIKTLYFPSVSK